MIVCKEVIVGGRVQGVFFRVSTRDKASELGLAGGVRNLRDGRVEVVVCGEQTPVDELIKWLKIGPKFAKVTTIEVVELPVGADDSVESEGFHIWPGR